MSRKEEGRGLDGMENCVDASLFSQKCKERLIAAVNCNCCNRSINRKTTKTQKQKWETNNCMAISRDKLARYEKIRAWLKKENLKRETDPLLKAPQNNATGTKKYSSKNQ